MIETLLLVAALAEPPEGQSGTRPGLGTAADIVLSRSGEVAGQHGDATVTPAVETGPNQNGSAIFRYPVGTLKLLSMPMVPATPIPIPATAKLSCHDCGGTPGPSQTVPESVIDGRYPCARLDGRPYDPDETADSYCWEPSLKLGTVPSKWYDTALTIKGGAIPPCDECKGEAEGHVRFVVLDPRNGKRYSFCLVRLARILRSMGRGKEEAR